MTQGELRAKLAEKGDLYEFDEEGIRKDPKLIAQMEADLEAVVQLAGSPGWKKLQAAFTEYREALVTSMLGSAPDAALPTIRAKVALLDEFLGWPAAFKVQSEEILTATKD
jgi:hypothetical protein